MADELTPAELKFFETGELPPELAAEYVPPVETVVPPVVATPAPTGVPVEAGGPVPAAPPAPDPFLANLQRQLNEAEGRRLAAEHRLNSLAAELEAARQPQNAAPDPNTDPFGNLQHQIANINKMLQNLQTSTAQQEQQSQQIAQLQQFTTQVKALRDTFAKTVPDFPAAYQHLREARMQDLRDAGVPEVQLPNILLQDEMALAQTAITSGRNPAAILYDMAKRHGYAAVTPPPPPPPAATKLAQIQAGLDAARNVSRAAGDVELSAEALKDASESDLDKLVQSDDMWHKVVGGGASRGIF